MTLTLLAAFVGFPAEANDSSASIGLGGLELKQNDTISMNSEDLYLSLEKGPGQISLHQPQ